MISESDAVMESEPCPCVRRSPTRGCRNIGSLGHCLLELLILTRFKSVYEFPVFSFSHPSPSFSRPLFSIPSFLFSTMVNWESPVTIANELSPFIPSVPHSPFFFLSLSDSLQLAGSLVKFIHVVDGIYLCVSSFISGVIAPAAQGF